MIQTLSKYVKWREDNEAIFICDCKRMLDLKIPFKYKDFMKKLSGGVSKEKLSCEEKKVFSDFEKMNLLSEIKIQNLKEKDFEKAMEILDNEIDKRVRSDSFLYEKFKQFPNLFIGLFLDGEIIGTICGFPREDYLLISEVAVDSRFTGRGFGRKLVEMFEKVARGKYSKINIGAEDKSIGFYVSLKYKPFLLIQFKKEDYSEEDFEDFNIIKAFPERIEIETKNCEIHTIKRLRRKYPKANFQYIFTKILN